MKIGNNTLVALTYELNVDGQIVDKATEEKPLEFMFGVGQLLPKFESNIEGKSEGDSFEFTLEPAEGYGEMYSEAIIDLPKDIFKVDGVIAEDMLEIGNQLPMADNEGNRMIGTVIAVKEDTVTMDFNHQLAGKTLNFKGKIVGVREVSQEDMLKMMSSMGGCGCGCDGETDCESSDCNCDCQK